MSVPKSFAEDRVSAGTTSETSPFFLYLWTACSKLFVLITDKKQPTN
jgi:hypothetical protein